MQIPAVSDGVLGIYETHFPVQNLERSVAFYSDSLGLELARVIPERKVAFFWIGGSDNGMLGLWESGTAPMSMQLHFALRATKDMVLDGCRRLKTQGITPLGFQGEPVEEPVVIGWMPALSLYFKDPDGHSLELIHMLADMPDAAFGVQSWSDWTART